MLVGISASVNMEYSDEIKELWLTETKRIYDSIPMLSWEACELAAWNKIYNGVDETINKSNE